MNINVPLTCIAGYVTVGTLTFNLLRYFIKFNLTSSVILSISISLLLSEFITNESLSAFFVENISAIIILGAVVGVVLGSIRNLENTTDSTEDKNTNNNSSGIINNKTL